MLSAAQLPGQGTIRPMVREFIASPISARHAGRSVLETRVICREARNIMRASGGLSGEQAKLLLEVPMDQAKGVSAKRIDLWSCSGCDGY